MNKLNNIVIILSVILFGCGEKIDVSPNKGEGHKSAAFSGVVNNIDQMAEKPWDKSAYTNIKNNQIPNLKKATERTSAQSKLKTTYEKVMVRDANAILDGGCKKPGSHSTLSAIFTELNSFKDAPGYGNVSSKKKTHDEASKFADSGIGYQSVSSYRDVYYDVSYEKRKKDEAKKWLANSNLKCADIKSKLTRLTNDGAYVNRRKQFCEDITKRYVASANPAISERNAAIRSIETANLGSNIESSYNNRIENHYKQLNPKQ